MTFVRKEHTGNAVVTTLATDLTSGASACTLTDGTGWPTGGTGPFYFVIDPGLATEEKVLATARSGVSISGMTRGVDGTSPAAHTAGTGSVEHVFTAVEADEANQALVATLGAITGKGDIPIGTANQTLGIFSAPADGRAIVADSSQPTGYGGSALTSTALAADSVTATQVASSVAGAGLVGGSGVALAVNADGTTLIVSGDAVSINPASITQSLIASGFRMSYIVANATALQALASLVEGDQAWVADTDVRCAYDGTKWVVTSGATVRQAVVTGGPTVSTTALTLGTVTIPAMPAQYGLSCSAFWSGYASIADDTFDFRITVDGTAKGTVTNRFHTVNERRSLAIPCSTTVTIAANTACTVRCQVVRTGGTGVFTEETSGLLEARMSFG